MTTDKNRMRLAFAELTQGRTVTIEERLMFEAGYMAGQKVMQERAINAINERPTWISAQGAVKAVEALET